MFSMFLKVPMVLDVFRLSPGGPGVTQGPPGGSWRVPGSRLEVFGLFERPQDSLESSRDPPGIRGGFEGLPWRVSGSPREGFLEGSRAPWRSL